MRWKRWVAGIGLAGLGLLGFTAAGAAGFVVWLATPRGNGWLEWQIEHLVSSTMAAGSFEIDGLNTDVLWNLELDGLRISDDSGRALVALGPSRARYNASSLLTGPLVVHSLDASGLALVLDSGPDGRMALADLFGPPSGSTEPFSLPIDLDLRDVSVEGVRVGMNGSVDVRGGVLVGTLVSEGERFDLADLSLCAHVLVPGPTTACFEGPVLWDGVQATLSGAALTAPGTALGVKGSAGTDALELDVLVGGLDLKALDPVASHVGLDGTWGGELGVHGPIEGFAITGRLAGVGDSRGSLVVDGRAGVDDAGVITWGGDLDALGFHVEDAYPGTGRPVVLDGALGLDGTGLRFPDDLRLGLTYQGRAEVESTYILENTDMVAVLDQGVLTLERGEFFGIAGQLDATGTIDVVNGPLALKVVGDIDPREIAELGITGLGGTGTADLRITGDLKQESGRFGVGGRVVMAPFQYTDDVRFERLVADLRGGVDGADFTFDVDAVGTNGVAYGLTMESLDAPGVHVTSRSKDLAAAGPARVEGIAYPGLGTFQSADVEFDASLPNQGDQHIVAGIGLGEFDIQTFPGSGGRATVDMTGQRVAYDVLLDAWGRELAASRGTYDLGQAHLEADLLRVAPTARLAWESQGPVVLTVVDGGVQDASLVLKGLQGNLDVQGDFATTGTLDGTVRLDAFQLDVLAELYPDTFPGLSGLATLDATVSGPASDPTFTGSTEVTGFWLEDVARWLDFAGTFDVRHGDADLHLGIGSAGEPLATVDGILPVLADLSAQPGLDPSGQTELVLVLKPGPLDRLEHVTTTELGLPEGQISAQIVLDGRLGDPDLRVSGVVEGPVGGWSDAGRVELDLRRSGTDLDLWADLREGLADRVRVTGGGTTRMGQVFASVFEGTDMPDTSDLELWLDNMAVSAVLNGLPADSIVRAGELGVPAGGELVGGFTASGSPWTPEIEGGVHWFRPVLGNEALEGAYFSVLPSDAGLEIDSALSFAGGDLTVSGPLPIRIDLREESSEWAMGELGLEIGGSGVPLGLLSVVDRGITDASGLASVEGTIQGTFADPVPDLTAKIIDGALTYTPMGLRVFDIQGDLGAGQRRLKITKLTAGTSPVNQVGILEDKKGSRIRITGAANLEKGVPTELSARAVLDDAWIMGTYEAALRLGGEVVVSGAWPHLNVLTQGKDLELVSGRIIYNSDAAAVAGALEPSDRLVIHRDGQQRRTERVEELPMYADFNVDVGVDLNRNLEVIAAIPFFDDLGSITANLTRANAVARLGGNLDIALDAKGNPLLSGEVDVADGSVQVLRTQFSLDEGRLVFLGGDVGNTPIDISGSTTIEGTPVELQISGTADEPKLKTTAEGFDETQVLVMLVTGRSPDSLRGDASRAAQSEAEALAGTAAALVASSLLSGAATGALTIEPDGGIRIGAPWSSSVLTQLVLLPLADPGENVVAFSLEWTLARRLLLELGAGSTFQWTDLSWETRF
ncbi:MAG: translocation/assembly module TamB domain-containing protein [Myxococcota bacterium]